MAKNRTKTVSTVGQQEYAVADPQKLKDRFGLSDDDLKFLETKLPDDRTGIGPNKYWHLKEKDENDLTDLERKQIADYEQDLRRFSESNLEKYVAYTRLVRGDRPVRETVEGLPLDKRMLYYAFLEAWQHETGGEYVQTPDSIANLEVLVKYFSLDPDFFKCRHLITELNGLELKPSFKKGLLIIGLYGNGKSTSMRCFANIFKRNTRAAIMERWDNAGDWSSRRFDMAYCHQLVVDFDGFQEPQEKSAFFKRYSGHTYCFDDLTKEDTASNYGRKEIIRIMLENRYGAGVRTHGTINFPDDAPHDIKAALMQLGNRYGSHIYDRAYEMFNIIVFKGKSYR